MKQMKRSVLLALGALTACGTDQVAFTEASGEGSEAQVSGDRKLFASSSQLWTTDTVGVCWDPETVPSPKQRDLVRNAVARTWSFAGDIEFTDWGLCSDDGPSIPIRVVDLAGFGPFTFGIGVDTQIIVLNHTFQNYQINEETFENVNFSIKCDPTSTPEQIEECIETIAIHEFGHVLGFDHEQNWSGAAQESDFPDNCADLKEETVRGDTLYAGDWDLNSVMNYCSPSYPGPGLSRLDFDGMQAFYGTSPRFVAALVGGAII